MNKTAIKNFAIWARNKLISDIKYKAGLLGITEQGVAKELPQSTNTTKFYDIGTAAPYAVIGDAIHQRNALIDIITAKTSDSNYRSAYNSIIEEVAYTWFNRLIAVRFMEVNDYIPGSIRVLSSENAAKVEPDLVTTPFDSELEFNDKELSVIRELKTENKTDELFQVLFIKQCNALNELLPRMFEQTNDYTELLINLPITDNDGVIYHLVHDIPESNFNVEEEGQIEIIGWLYQYYNTEPKQNVDGKVAKGIKVAKEDIASKTQLFTPDWIVRYMVENSLGRLWIEGHPDDELKTNWKYYLEEAEQEESVKEKLAKIRKEYARLNPEDIKLIDPCMGSGHILVYAFDVLMQIYENEGYTRRDAAESILENNIYGLDIDDRAAQLAYFAVLMKAREYSKNILKKQPKCNVYAIQESNSIDRSQLKYFGAYMGKTERAEAEKQLNMLLDSMKDAKTYGSIINVAKYDWELLFDFVGQLDVYQEKEANLFESVEIVYTQQFLNIILFTGRMLSSKYDITITNPPYLGSGSYNNKLAEYVKQYYVNSKNDMFAVFMERCLTFANKNSFLAMITQHSWMFISSYEKLRHSINNINCVNMLHLGARAFDEISGEVVQSTSFVFCRQDIENYKTCFRRLTDGKNEKEKVHLFFNNPVDFKINKLKFSQIPSAPWAYWWTDNIISLFSNDKIGDVAKACKGMMPGSDNIRFHWEINNLNVALQITSHEDSEKCNLKWYPYYKGGSFRRWYGNRDRVVDYMHDGIHVKKTGGDRNPDIYFKNNINWSKISSGYFSAREGNIGALYDDAACQCYVSDKERFYYILGLLNSKVSQNFLWGLNKTYNYISGDVARIPVCEDTDYKKSILSIVRSCVTLSKNDWDSFETSWDFMTHPLIIYKSMDKFYPVGEDGKFIGPIAYSIEESFNAWELNANGHFETLKANEEELNRIFIDIYGLQDELTSEVEDKDVTIRKADLTRDIKSLLSYAVGCMFGRYSLDKEGLAYAGGEWDISNYHKFIPDDDNIIPITDEEYLEDDIVARLCEWLKVVYGAETLQENLDFIAKALGNTEDTARKTIRKYFLNEFFKDHCKIYQKRPIYWFFDSGKNNGFKALVYLHRYDADTIGNMRTEYVGKMQRAYEKEVERMQDIIDNDTNAREVGKAAKTKEKLLKQIKECREYDEKIAHLALSRIELDLDDGVKVNYEKVQTANDGKIYQVLAKI